MFYEIPCLTVLNYVVWYPTLIHYAVWYPTLIHYAVVVINPGTLRGCGH